MSQTIRFKRGGLERVSAATGSLVKGEILIATGSSIISASNGSSILFVANENGHVEASNRILRTTGSNVPIFSSSVYNGLVDGVPFYASGSSTLYLLGGNSNEAINLVGNIQPFSTSVDSRLDVLETFSSSADNRYVLSGSITQTTWDNIANKPSGIVSQSTNLTPLNQFTSSYFTDSASFDNRIVTEKNRIDAILSAADADKDTFVEIVSLINSIDTTNDNAFASYYTSSNARIGSLENITGSYVATSSFNTLSSSIATSLNNLSQSSGFINYVTNSVQNLTGIEVADFDSNVAVTFTNGTLKFIFGTPTAPSSVAASLTGFATDRFNKVNDTYTINGSWSNGGYTLISASLYEGSTLLTQVGSGTSLSYSATTSGSHTYQLQYTASSPLDGTLYTTATTTTGTVSKTNPASPTLSPSATIQLGVTSNQMEQGATGSITFTSSSANPSNSWNLTSVTTNVSSPYYVTGSATGSTSISITATANYASPTGDNNPDLTTTSTTTTTYTKIRSLRYGASSATSFTAGELENLALWDTTLGGTIGTIAKGTTTASGQSVTISWTGDKYHYIVFNSSLSNLSNITTSGFGVLGQFGVTTVGQYKVYKSTTLQAGGAGSSITYTLT